MVRILDKHFLLYEQWTIYRKLDKSTLREKKGEAWTTKLGGFPNLAYTKQGEVRLAPWKRS